VSASAKPSVIAFDDQRVPEGSRLLVGEMWGKCG